jgi:hypothetical protein
VFVDGVRIVPASSGQSGYGCWWGDRVLYQARDVEIRSCRPDGSDDRTEVAQGASWLAAGPGGWVAHQAMPGRLIGALTSWRHFAPGTGALAVAQDGSAVFVATQFFKDRGISRYRPQADEPDLVLADVQGPLLLTPYSQVSALTADEFVWRDGWGKLHGHGLAVASIPWACLHPTLFRVDGVVWVCYLRDRDEVVAHPLHDASRGLIAGDGENRTYGPAGSIYLGNVWLRWSATAGEGASDIQVKVFDPVADLVPLSTPAVEVNVPALSRDCLIAVYHATRHDKSVAYPGHVEIITNGQDAERRHSDRKVIADMASEPSVADGELYAIFAVIDVDNMDDARAVADRRGVPIMAYYDGRGRVPDVSQLVAGWDFLSPMLYCDPHESVEDFRRWADGQVAATCGRGHQVILTVQAFDRNGHERDRAKLMHLSALWHELFEAHADVFGLAPFAVLRDSVDLATNTILPGKGGIHGQADLTAWWDAYFAAAVEPPPPPNPEPIPEPEPMKIPSAVVATIHAFVAAFGIPQGDGSEEWIEAALRRIPDGWMHRLAQTIAARHGVKWGRKRASASRPLSKESIALNEHGLHGWDLLSGAATGRPTLQTDSYHDLIAEDNQVFVPVDPFDHLGNITAPTNRPTIQTPLWGLSSFDLSTRLAEGDRRWIDQMLKPAALVARVVVASWFRRPAGEDAVSPQAKLDISRARFRETLRTLAADRLTCQPVLLCDTAKFGLTRAQALDEVQKCHTILLEFPEAIEGVAGGNELSHGVEADYMSDPSFWAEVDAIIDPRFPFTPGAGHGGEGVAMLGGSYLVHHADRGLSAEANAEIMKRGQDIGKRPVVDDEQIGVAEPGTPGQRVYNADYLLASVREAIRLGLGGVTYHPHAGLTADVDQLGPVQREAWRLFVEATGAQPPTQEADVTTEQIATVFGGGFFEQVSTLLNLSGTVEARRAEVHGWTKARIAVIEQAYRDIFKRGCDLEGFGSRLRLYLDRPGYTDANLRKDLQAGYDAGGR